MHNRSLHLLSFSLAIALAVGLDHARTAWAASAKEDSVSAELHWQQLPPLPDREGFAAPFTGVSGRALIVAGGANFPQRRPWDGGTKVWYDSIFLLPHAGGPWKVVGQLPRPVAYGISVTVPEGVVCVGGGDAQGHFRDVFRLHWTGQRIEVVSLAPLPKACAFASGALLDHTLYVVGGIERPDSTDCLKTLWSLDLSRPDAAWQELPACPGPERMLATAGAAQGSFYLFSGTRLTRGSDGKPVREYLRDAWRYTPGRDWQRLADLPRSAVAAPSPAPLMRGTQLLVISGDDGTRLGFKPETEHPGFPRDVLAYDLRRDVWTVPGTAPFSLATAPTAVWEGRAVIANGEARPGYRTPAVWTLLTDEGGR